MDKVDKIIRLRLLATNWLPTEGSKWNSDLSVDYAATLLNVSLT